MKALSKTPPHSRVHDNSLNKPKLSPPPSIDPFKDKISAGEEKHSFRRSLTFDKIVLFLVLFSACIAIITRFQDRQAGVPEIYMTDDELQSLGADGAGSQAAAPAGQQSLPIISEADRDTLSAEVPAPLIVSQTLWTIQLVTYASAGRADQEIQTLKEKHLEAWRRKSGKYYELCVGKFATEAEARNHLKVMKTQSLFKRYRDSYIKKVIVEDPADIVKTS